MSRKYTSRKHELTREDLDRNNVRIEFDNEGQPLIYQKYSQTGKKDFSYMWSELRNQKPLSFHHKVSNNTYTSLVVTLKIDGVINQYIVSNVVWVYFNDIIPEGCDVDHINDDPLDNRPCNLQILTRTENLHKRGVGVNQSNCHLTEEERVKVKQYKELLKKLNDEKLKEIQYWTTIYDELKSAGHWYAYQPQEDKDEYMKLRMDILNIVDGLRKEKKQINNYRRAQLKDLDLSEWDVL